MGLEIHDSPFDCLACFLVFTCSLLHFISGGSKSRRSKNARGPNQNGLHYSTYNATIRRQGVFVSPTAGAIDLNQELCDPMEKEFSRDWESTMNAAIGVYLADVERRVFELFTVVAQQMVTAFAHAGMDSHRLNAMANTANRTCTTAIKAAFQRMKEVASNAQRDLNRSLLPAVTTAMTPGYDAAFQVPRGAGTFDRQKAAVGNHSQVAVVNMFDEATKQLLSAIGALVKQLASMILGAAEVILKSLTSVYSVCWDDEQHQSKGPMVDPAVQEKIRACRDKLLPDLNKLRASQDETMGILGIEREELEFEIVGVDTWESRQVKEMKEAQAKGNYFEILDSDDEDEAAPSVPVKPAPSTVRVKSEPCDTMLGSEHAVAAAALPGRTPSNQGTAAGSVASVTPPAAEPSYNLWKRNKNCPFSSTLELNRFDASQAFPGCMTGTNIVFTGKFNSLSQRDAAKLVRTLGGRVQESVSPETKYFVVGDKCNMHVNLITAKVVVGEKRLFGLVKLHSDRARMIYSNGEASPTRDETAREAVQNAAWAIQGRP